MNFLSNSHHARIIPFTRPTISRSYCDPVIFFHVMNPFSRLEGHYYFCKFPWLMLIISFYRRYYVTIFPHNCFCFGWHSYTTFVYARTNSFVIIASFYFLCPKQCWCKTVCYIYQCIYSWWYKIYRLVHYYKFAWRKVY